MRENGCFKSQAVHWQELYTQLKEQLAEKVTLALEEPVQKPMEEERQPELMIQELEMRRQLEAESKTTTDSEVQVDG